MLVSIIVPVYNVEKYLVQCIESIIRQSYNNIEIILVDDGSVDNSGQICDEYSQKYSQIASFHKSNGGLSSARNFGLENANGEYIAFVDSDDIIDSDMIKTMVENLESNDADISGIDYLEFEDVLPQVNENKRIKVVKENIVNYFLQKNRLYCVVRYLYKKELLEDLSFDETIRLGEDQDFIFRYIQNAKKVVVTDYNGYFYRQNMSSLSNGKLKDNHLFDLNNRLRFVESVDKHNRKVAEAHYLKGLLAYWCRGIIYGVESKEDYVNNYAKLLSKSKWKIIFSKSIEFKYKCVAATLLLGQRTAIKIIKKYLGQAWKR